MKINFLKNRFFSRFGFTLVELLVSMALITTVFTSVLALVNYGIYAVTYIQDNLIASFLAQEGIELVLQKRNQNWLDGADFKAGLLDGGYRIDYRGLFDTDFSEQLLFDETNGFQYTFGSPSVFQRQIQITEISEDHYRVSSRVDWRSRGNNFNVVIEDHFYDWFGVLPD